MTVELIKPCTEFEQSYRAYILELGDEERYPFPLDFEHSDFNALLERLGDFATGTNIPAGYVPSSTFWLVDDTELIGVSNLRHRLNDAIRKCGGHIGLGIRPSFRGQGHGNTLMALTIQQAALRGMGELHLHCHAGNEASARMIVHNGGVLESEIEYGQPATTIQRYRVAAAQKKPGI